MASKRHGKIVGWERIHSFDYAPESGIEIATYQDGTRAVNIHSKLTERNKHVGSVTIPLSYKAIKAIVDGLVELYGKEEVYLELGIKGEKRKNDI